MEKQTIPLNYANSLIYELEKAFWDERGRGARFRLTTVGQGYYEENCKPILRSRDLEQILQTIGDLLQREGIVSEVSYNREDRLLRMKVKGCLHQVVEEKMISRGVEPFTCVPANLVALAIEEILDRPVELAEVKVEDGACHLLLVIFDHRPTLE